MPHGRLPPQGMFWLRCKTCSCSQRLQGTMLATLLDCCITDHTRSLLPT